MDFVVGNSALRSFYRFLQALHKVGDELFIEPRSTKLALSTVNPSRSAFALFTVSADFFESFLGPLPQVGAGSTTASQSSRRADQDCTLDSTSTSSASPIAYKVLLKTVTNIFKQKTNLDVIEKCRIHLDTGGETETGAQRIVIQLLCKYGIKKTHKLHFETCDSVQALYSKTQCQNRWTVAPKIVHDWLSFFSNRLEEVTFKCGADWVVMKSFSEDSPDAEKRSLQTELTLDPEDFDLFHVADVTDVTFSMKDFKSVLNLAEALAQPIAAYFNGPGQPLTLSISQMNIFTADFVLATFSESALTQSSSRPALSPREETRQPAPSQTVSNGGEDHRMDDQPRVEPAYPQSEGQRTPAAKPTYRPGISVFASSPSPADPSKHQTLRDSPHYQPDHPGSHRLGLYNLSPDVGPAGSAFNRSLHASLPRMSTPGHQLFQRTDQQTYTSSRSYGQITLPRPASSVPKVVEEDDLPAGQHRPDRARAPSTGILPSHDQRQNDGFGAFKHKLMACDSMDVDEVPTECERGSPHHFTAVRSRRR
ncbi:Rad9-domain-containing protein [Zopfochytrium polystomum]|nr:Rad9-domain-containing protein [Zopfochytrium polystomum]